MLKKYRLRDYNFILLFLVIGMMIFGVFLINHADSSFTLKQAIGVGVAIVIMIALSLLDYHIFLDLKFLIYPGILVILVAVLLFGVNVNQATRWFNIGPITFQPSELAKVLMIVFMAGLLSDFIEKEQVSTFKGIAVFAASIIPVAFLIFREPDLSTTICTVVVMILMLYLAGLRYKIIFIVLLILIPVAGTFLWYIQRPDQKLLNQYQVDRILTFLFPSEHADMNTQQANSVMAIGSGQLMGKGLSPDSDVVSMSSSRMVSEQQTDFIFSVVGESFGFVGSVIVIAIFLIIVLQCIRISRRAKDPGGMLLAGGAACLFSVQSFINIGVATALLPNTGIPLPFLSYGLSSLMSSAIILGIVLNVGLQPERY